VTHQKEREKRRKEGRNGDTVGFDGSLLMRQVSPISIKLPGVTDKGITLIL
jgi:hypothetical protein